MTEPLRLSCKVIEKEGKQYMCPAGWFHIPTGTMHAIAMSDEGTFEIAISPDEWNALPFRWFVDDGPAPKPIHRTITLPEELRPKGT